MLLGRMCAPVKDVGIEISQLLRRHIQTVGHGVQTYAIVDIDGVEIEGVRHVVRESIALGVFSNNKRGDEFRHIILGFPGDPKLPEVFRKGPVDGVGHAVFPAIISGKGDLPVAELVE